MCNTLFYIVDLGIFFNYFPRRSVQSRQEIIKWSKQSWKKRTQADFRSHTWNHVNNTRTAMLLSPKMRGCLPLLSPCDVWGVIQRGRGPAGGFYCSNGCWWSFHHTHWEALCGYFGISHGGNLQKKQTDWVSSLHEHVRARSHARTRVRTRSLIDV